MTVFLFQMCILNEEEDGIQRHFLRKLEDEFTEETQFLLFPFNSGNMHWLLLVLDVATWEWSFYDSLRDTMNDNTNPYLKDARKIVSILYFYCYFLKLQHKCVFATLN